MVIDPSALLAVLQNEPERRAFNESIEAAEQVSLSTASFVEISMIVESRLGADGIRDLELFIAKAASPSILWTRSRRISQRRPFAATAKAGIPPASTSATAFPMHWPAREATRCYSRATTLLSPTSSAIPRVPSLRPNARWWRCPVPLGFSWVPQHRPPANKSRSPCAQSGRRSTRRSRRFRPGRKSRSSDPRTAQRQ